MSVVLFSELPLQSKEFFFKIQIKDGAGLLEALALLCLLGGPQQVVKGCYFIEEILVSLHVSNISTSRQWRCQPRQSTERKIHSS